MGKETLHKVSYSWRVSRVVAEEIISVVYPFLVVKKRQAQICLAYRKLQNLKVKSFPGQHIVPEELREEIFQMLKSLNSRGPKSVETNTPDINSLLVKIESELSRNIERKIGDNLSVKRQQVNFVWQ